MKIEAKLLEKFDAVDISTSFKKREFVVEFSENPKYPEYLKFELIQDKCGILDDFEIGQTIEVYFNLKGRKWVKSPSETIYFNSLQAWKISNWNDQPVARQSAAVYTEDDEQPPLDAYSSDEFS